MYRNFMFRTILKFFNLVLCSQYISSHFATPFINTTCVFFWCFSIFFWCFSVFTCCTASSLPLSTPRSLLLLPFPFGMFNLSLNFLKALFPLRKLRSFNFCCDSDLFVTDFKPTLAGLMIPWVFSAIGTCLPNF